MEQHDPNKPEPERKSFFGRSTGGAFAIGTISGAVAEAVISLCQGASIRWKNTAIIAIGTGALSAGLHLLFRKAEPQPATTIPPIQPPAPPKPQALGLAGVPMVLDMLAGRGELTAEQKTTVLQTIQQGNKGFAADIAVTSGFITKQQAEQVLNDQCVLKAQAAAQDIQNILEHGTIAAPAFLKANWGNNGVTPTAATPTRTDGASAAANIAQNLVVIANAKPELAAVLFDGVIAAASLTNGIRNGDSPIRPLGKLSAQWRDTMNQALTTAANAAPQLMVDQAGKPIDINAFIAARNAEINAGVAQTLQLPPASKGISK